ncbi:diacylglycerol kinase theta isoform X5 [Musca domestica]|uniref:Diacylglycerol kinase n=1 Tax=Musca domestica TaxID=7370 RepID=A0ABM3V058_MUSDO|nr:diacylglycerol kinase theta isoform X5 [Musca domestica]
MDSIVRKMADGGHTFVKKNFHKPTYCHHCSDILWFGLIGQGYICEVCNFIIHERCVTNVVTPCSGIAPCIIKNPVAHCWSEPTQHKKKFCTVCRKRLDDAPSVHCIVCEYYAHLECQDFAVPDCTENATYVPGKELLNVKHQHHWREGNLPSNSKCVYCKKTCWSSECLTGYRCEWCGLVTHAGCRMYLPTECTFGCLQPIYLPPHCVSIPRTEVPIKEIMGVRKTESESNLVRDYSCPDETSTATQIAVATGINEEDIGIDDNAENTKTGDNEASADQVVEEQINQTKIKDSLEVVVAASKRDTPKAGNRKKCQKNIQKSPSSSSSLHLFYTNIVNKIPYTGGGGGSGRKHLSSNTDDDEVDGGVCDVSGGDISDDYDHCDVGDSEDPSKSHRRGIETKTAEVLSDESSGRGGQQLTPGTGTGSDIEYHGDIEGESTHHEGFYETSDTGGELTNTDDIDIDSSMNLLSNLSCNSSNSNTSIEKRISLNRHRNAHNLQLSAAMGFTPGTPSRPKRGSANTALGAFESTKQKTAAKPIPAPSRGHRHPALSSPNSSDCSPASPIPPHPATAPHPLSPVGRSKSFQEPGVKLHAQSPGGRYKKYARFFQRRRSKRSNASGGGAKVEGKNIHSNYSLDTMYQNIEITIQDEDGNYQPYDDNYDTCDRHRSDDHLGDADEDDDEEILKEYSQLLGSRLRPYHHHSAMYDSAGGGIHSDDGGGGDISDGASSRSRSRLSDNEHVFGKLLKRMRRFSMGWRKPRYHKRRARSISEEFSSGDAPRFKDEESVDKNEAMSVVAGGSAAGCSSGGSSSHYRPESASGHKSDKSDKEKEKKEREREEKDIEAIKVFDGNNSFRRQLYRVITVPRTYTLEQLLTTALRAFHISRDPSAFYLTDLYAPVGMEDSALQDPNPVLSLNHMEGKRPAIFLRFQDKDNGFVRVYPGKLQCSLEEPYVSVPVDTTTTIKDLIRDALDRFGLQDNPIDDYRCSQVLLDSGVTERILSWNERPWNIMKQMGKDSIRQMELMRFYLQHRQDPHGPNIALFVGNLDPGKSQRKYEDFLNKYLTEDSKFTSIGPIYYEYGSVVLTYEDAQKAVRAFYILREVRWDGKDLLVMLLPNIEPSMVPPDINPLLVFVNVKSGGCQGLELISNFRKLLNPFQVFNLENGGPLPGLYVFRHIPHYKILVCGGDGTVGWVLQCLDNVGQDSECSSPPCAILPLGTGNDLARVLCWGSGYTGDQDPLSYLREVIEAEDIRLDRWTVVFHPEEKPEEQILKVPTNTTGKKKKAHQAHLSQQTDQHHQEPAITSSEKSGAADDECEGTKNEDNTQIFVMNNYFGIGLDADLCLDFHNARMENPFKFNSRLHNKGVYVKMGLRKMMGGRKCTKDLQKELHLEVDGKVVELPPCEGIIILNILSWGSGANPWGPDKDDRFSTPNHYDGLLEIVGVTGVVHLGQIQSGIRYANRIAQGGHIKMHLYSDLPVQVDGEPWVQCSGDIVVLKSALRAWMLRKVKSKRRLTEPHISPAVLSLSSTAAATSSSQTALQIVAQVTGQQPQQFSEMTNSAVMVTNANDREKDKDKEQQQQQMQQQQEQQQNKQQQQQQQPQQQTSNSNT